MATAATRKPKPSLGAQIDKMWDIREKKRNLEASIKDLDSQLATIEAELGRPGTIGVGYNRELLEMGKKVPGAEAFTKKRLNLRSL